MPLDASTSVDDLIRAVANDQDVKSFEALFEIYAPRLKSYFMRLGADSSQSEEWIQEVMISIWRKAHTFDASRAAGSTWIYTIARNKRIDALRRLKPQGHYEPEAYSQAAQDSERFLDATKRADRVRSAIDDLAPEQADVIRRVYFADEPSARVAEQTGAPVGTVKSRMRLALGHLRRALQNLEGDR